MENRYIPVAEVMRALADGREVTTARGMRYRLDGDTVMMWNFIKKKWEISIQFNTSLSYAFMHSVVQIG